MSKRPPEVHDVHGLIVHRTHDVELATRLVREWLDVYAEPIPAGFRTWLRIGFCPPACGEHAYHYHPAKPGAHGSFRAVEFPDDGRPIGTRAETPS